VILRILKQVTLSGVGSFPAGAVVNIPSDVAPDWIASGKARYHDGKPFVAESKAVSPAENKMEAPPAENKKAKPKRKRKK